LECWATIPCPRPQEKRGNNRAIRSDGLGPHTGATQYRRKNKKFSSGGTPRKGFLCPARAPIQHDLTRRFRRKRISCVNKILLPITLRHCLKSEQFGTACCIDVDRGNKCAPALVRSEQIDLRHETILSGLHRASGVRLRAASTAERLSHGRGTIGRRLYCLDVIVRSMSTNPHYRSRETYSDD
jgi:hypothetical protein